MDGFECAEWQRGICCMIAKYSVVTADDNH